NVVCVDKIPVRYKYDVLLKLKASSTCEETKARIQSVLEHLCGEDCKLEIYQKDDTDEIMVYGDSIEADPEGMAGKFNNDNITDKVEVDEAVSRMGQRSKIVLISLLIAGLLLAALLIAGYFLKAHRAQSKGLRLAEDSFQVDQDNQGNTLLSVAPLPQQEPLDKPIINGESPDSPPTNGHSATQTQVVDTLIQSDAGGVSGGSTASAFRPGKIDRDPVMMRGDYVSRKGTEELGRTETSEECRHPWHADHLEKDSTGSQSFECIHVAKSDRIVRLLKLLKQFQFFTTGGHCVTSKAPYRSKRISSITPDEHHS
ncbi:Hematopoietic progenitor cell antigen CD34, partial [Anabarilius grahami]